MSSLLRFYSSSLKTHPKTTNAMMTGVLFGIGDIIAQLQFADTPDTNYNPMRTLRPFIYGAFIFSFIGDKWYRILNTKIKISGKPTDHWMNTVARVVFDQLFFAPVGIPFYFSVMTLMEGGSFLQVKERLNEIWWSTLVTNWAIWPAFQFCNFSLLPVQHRLLAANLMSIFWNTFLSYTNAHSSPVDKD
ncbi:ethanol metabolism protein Ecym_2728 [Eremothecium cymbalariae DBVPG|uniref:Protein SYM1 n=1 Tax=Eremothecium cymbalariae (strain CBS 270.75 / DBVPG 7215 / KCTC 17166 / NRRL Y-17582) TaxID=931890 RepID=G8JPG3_ERECY|nr:Hypothetical protein Ecym_2728 [Eremothecium cymbalariae DBVPG\